MKRTVTQHLSRGPRAAASLAFAAALACTVFFAACGTGATSDAGPSGITFSMVKVERSGGQECEAEYGRCAKVDIEYPVAEGADQYLVEEINDSVQTFLRGTLATLGGVEDDGVRPVELFADDFVTGYVDFLNRNPNSVSGGRLIEASTSVSQNSSKAISIVIDLSVYDGGAHPNSLVKTFNLYTETRYPVILEDLEFDTTGFRALAEKEFRRTRDLPRDRTLEDEGFFFGQGFTLPANFALTQEGLRLIYNPYEAASYAQGPTDFVIAWSALRSVFRVDRVQ